MQGRVQRQNLKEIRQGHRQAREEVVCQHYKAIYQFMVYLTNQAALAEDLTQEVFAAAWANIGSYKARASLKTWLHRIAYNKFIDSKRKLERDTTLLAKFKPNLRDNSEKSNPLHRVMADEHSSILYEAMHKLGPAEYIAIVLHYIQGFSFREMAKVLEQPAGTVKWRTSRALKKLRGILTDRVQL